MCCRLHVMVQEGHDYLLLFHTYLYISPYVPPKVVILSLLFYNHIQVLGYFITRLSIFEFLISTQKLMVRFKARGRSSFSSDDDLWLCRFLTQMHLADVVLLTKIACHETTQFQRMQTNESPNNVRQSKICMCLGRGFQTQKSCRCATCVMCLSIYNQRGCPRLREYVLIHHDTACST